MVNKSAIFDGLEEDEQELDNIFVPRSSVKKLVLKPKATSTIVSSAGKELSLIASELRINTFKKYLQKKNKIKIFDPKLVE